MSGCDGPDINKCVGDVDDDGTVNVNDLLDVITNWGACDALGACCINNVCHLDYTEAACDNADGVFYENTNSDPLIDESFKDCRDADCFSTENACTTSCLLPTRASATSCPKSAAAGLSMSTTCWR